MNILIVYASTTGNTESVANTLQNILSTTHTVDVQPASDSIDISGADLVLFGSSTWGDGEIQQSMQEMYDNFANMPLSGKKVAVFGCGDRAFPHFANAVVLIEEKLKALGANIVCPSLKIDGFPDDSQAQIEEWGKNLIM